MTKTIHKRQPEPDNEPSELIFINPHKDIFIYERPLGILNVETYKKEALEKLMKKIMDTIEPEFLEMPGFEMMRYKLIIKKYE